MTPGARSLTPLPPSPIGMAGRGRYGGSNAVDTGREFYQRQRETVSTAIDRGREAYEQARERGDEA